MDSRILEVFAFCFAAGMSWLLLQRRRAFFWASLVVSLASLGGYVFYLVPGMERLSTGDAVRLTAYLVLAAAVLLALALLCRRRFRKTGRFSDGFPVVAGMVFLALLMTWLPERALLQRMLADAQLYVSWIWNVRV